ncbi:hypothetical protein ACFL4G_04270 [Thermodesulfobacteriota bacterium]
MIEVITRTSPIPPHGITFYQDKEANAEYRRIIGGLAWPGVKPGFAVVVGEDLEEDTELKVHHMRVLAEAEEFDIGDLFSRCLTLRGEWKVGRWYGDPYNRPLMEIFRQLNKPLFERKEPRLYPVQAPHVDDPKSFEFCIQMIKKHLHPSRKALHFGESRIKSYLAEFPMEEFTSAGASDYPAIAALGYAVSALSIYPPRQEILARLKRQNVYIPR